jgi:hypothetical protein
VKPGGKYTGCAIVAALVFCGAIWSIGRALATTVADENPMKKAPGRWTAVDISGFDLGAGALKSVWGSSARDVYVGGSEGLLLHYDGREWQQMEAGATRQFAQIVGTSRDNVYILNVRSGRMSRKHLREKPPPQSPWMDYEPIVVHLDKGKWVPMDIKGPDVGAWHDATGIWAASKSDVFVTTRDGEILHYDGEKWSRMFGSAPAIPSRRVGKNEPMLGSSIFRKATSVADGIARGANAARRPSPEGGGSNDKNTADDSRSEIVRLYAIWGTSRENVYAVGIANGFRGVVLHYDGRLWTTESIPQVRELRDIAGSSASNIYVGVHTLHYDGATWTEIYDKNVGGAERAWVFGTSAVFGVGGYGCIYLFDGKEWKAMDSGTKNNLHAVWGSSPNDVWAVGDGGTILHYAGK